MKASLVAAGIALVAVLIPSAAAAPIADVTLRVDRSYDRPASMWRLRFSGTIASGAADEYVVVMGKKCGAKFATAVAGASTRAGGYWEAPLALRVFSGTFHARWGSRSSEPVTVRLPINVWVRKLEGRRYRVSVYSDQPQSIRGRPVELQWLGAGGWTRVRRAQLVAEEYGTFEATFTVPTRRLTLRVLVPAKTAAPCYAPGISKTWTS